MDIAEHNELAREDAAAERQEELGGGVGPADPRGGHDPHDPNGFSDPHGQGGQGGYDPRGFGGQGGPQGPGQGGVMQVYPPRGMVVPIGYVWASPEGMVPEATCAPGRLVWSPRVQGVMAFTPQGPAAPTPEQVVEKVTEKVAALADRVGSGASSLLLGLAPLVFGFLEKRDGAATNTATMMWQQQQAEANARAEVQRAEAAARVAEAAEQTKREIAKMDRESAERIAKAQADATVQAAQIVAAQQAQAAQLAAQQAAQAAQWQQMQQLQQSSQQQMQQLMAAPKGPSAAELMLQFQTTSSTQQRAADLALAEERRRADEKFALLQKEQADAQRKSDQDRYDALLREMKDGREKDSPASLLGRVKELESLKSALGIKEPKESNEGLQAMLAKTDPAQLMQNVSSAIDSVARWRAVELEGKKQLTMVEAAAAAARAQGAPPPGIAGAAVTMNLPAPTVTNTPLPPAPGAGAG